MTDKPAKPSLDELMKTAQQMQKSMQQAHEQLANMEIEGEAGGGLVKIIITGRHEAKRVIISNDALAEGKSVLQDLVAAAINDAVRKVEKASQDKMVDLTKELGLPPGFDKPPEEDE